mmetsp:Transcript_8114/g.22428  ORF Transcript_8114/g.22428 Transcript_8114/m.22428 type:complete len:201 (-) Transcript_8114:977-1579(-)
MLCDSKYRRSGSSKTEKPTWTTGSAAAWLRCPTFPTITCWASLLVWRSRSKPTTTRPSNVFLACPTVESLIVGWVINWRPLLRQIVTGPRGLRVGSGSCTQPRRISARARMPRTSSRIPKKIRILQPRLLRGALATDPVHGVLHVAWKQSGTSPTCVGCGGLLWLLWVSFASKMASFSRLEWVPSFVSFGKTTIVSLTQP